MRVEPDAPVYKDLEGREWRPVQVRPHGRDWCPVTQDHRHRPSRQPIWGQPDRVLCAACGATL